MLEKVIAAVIGLKGRKQSQEAIQITNQAFTEHLNLDLHVLLGMDTEEMIRLLEEKEGVNPENLENVADLFYELGSTMSEEGDEVKTAKLFFEHSLAIYKHIEETGEIYSIDRNHKIQEIEQHLAL